jgi:Vanillate O-demethylase oxygenase C-terminal domain
VEFVVEDADEVRSGKNGLELEGELRGVGAVWQLALADGGARSDQPDGVIREFEDTIFGQDQVVVESQRPERVPFDLAAELHLRFDAVAVAYRKAMRDLGRAASAPIGISAE